MTDKLTSLPEEMRHDIIVMEIAFENGKTAVKAIPRDILCFQGGSPEWNEEYPLGAAPK